MKIRTGFVSNSSSSSFVVFGVQLNNEKLRAMQERQEEEALKGWKKEPTHGEDCQCAKCTPPEVDEIEFDDIASKAGLDYNDLDHERFVGVCPTGQSDDETLRQFKARIATKISETFYKVEEKDIEFISFEYPS